MQNGTAINMPISPDLVFLGTFIHSNWQRELIILEDGALGVSGGKIVFLDKKSKIKAEGITFDNAEIIQLNENQFMMPGLIDTHAHASQFSFMGTGHGMELLDWLNTYTFPVESKITENLDFAAEVYRRCVERSLRCGSTTVSYYATIGLESTLMLVDIIEKLGQRAFVGKVNMDNESPKYYIEDTQKSVKDTRSFIENVLERKNDLVTPCVTPRFAITCTSQLLSQLADLAKEFSLPIQTHISENQSEIEFVKTLFPHCKSYSDVYDQTHLLGERTILGHGVYLTEDELELIKTRGSAVSHCPNSNFNLRSGVLDLKKLLQSGVKVGLGTDFGGGNSPSILDAMRRAMDASVVTSLNKPETGSPQQNGFGKKDDLLTYKDMFYLATLGSSQVLGLQDVIGNFSPGKDLDALLIDPSASGSPIECFTGETVDERFQKFLFQGDDRNIVGVFVKGKNVTPS